MNIQFDKLVASKKAFFALLFFAFVIMPFLYSADIITVGQVNMIGRYMCFAILALGLDLLWGYTGILSLCQFTFFCFGAYAMGIHLAHHGGPEGIIDANGWKIPACLFVVYPYDVGESSGDALVPGFWKPFWNLPLTVLLGLLIPGFASFVLGYFVFRSRVRGVYFAILTQAIAVATWLVFCRNDVKLCGTNGLVRFDVIAPAESLTTFSPIDAKDKWVASNDSSMDLDINKDGKIDQLDYSIAEVGYELSSDEVRISLYLITAACLFGSFLFCRWVVNSRLGKVLLAIRDDESTLCFFGYKPYVYKIFVFSLAGILSGLAGMLYVPQMEIITPSNMEAYRSLLVVVWVAVGGRGTLSGAVLGALVVNLLYNYFTSQHDFYLFSWNPDYWQILLGLMFVLVVLYLPNGLIGVLDKLRGTIDFKERKTRS